MFSVLDGEPVGNWGHAKLRLDKVIAKRREADGRPSVADWMLHDLRRSVSTLMAKECGVSVPAIEPVLGHLRPGASLSPIVWRPTGGTTTRTRRLRR